ncbi:hypothetical protein BN137_4265 [Cronobacter condimenti 1330]|uniref:Uncharacterized protein n=1 Tax=Cronobacter condimenti 1330 TaxID=1073999 RepID=K8AGC7_9ENTR|nr:hypothetical protein BN137_4265 [Cronobacter condimenti 1330]
MFYLETQAAQRRRFIPFFGAHDDSRARLWPLRAMECLFFPSFTPPVAVW